MNDSSFEGESEVEKCDEFSSEKDKVTISVSSDHCLKDASKEYVQLQRNIFLVFLVVSTLTFFCSAIFVGFNFSFSILIGALSGAIYLRLLSRGVGRLGTSSGSVGKIQLLVPVILVIAASKLPQLELLPCLVGFLLYKPSLIIHFLLKP